MTPVLAIFGVLCLAAALLGGTLRLPRAVSSVVAAWFPGVAGVILLFTALVHMGPSAAALSDWAIAAIGLGVVGGVAADRLIRRHAGSRRGALLALAGLGCHGVVDGLAFSAAFHAHSAMGVAAGLGIVLHKASAAVIVNGFARSAGFGRPAAMVSTVFIVAIASFAAAYGAQTFMLQLSAPVFAAILGASAGLLGYAGAAVLFEQRRRLSSPRGAAVAAASAVIAMVASSALPAFHTHSGHLRFAPDTPCPGAGADPGPRGAACPVFARRPGATP